tara:strand:- start:117 stop:710 length:594 start_codon:yes stop_codon:yes gene_type:complete
MKKVTLVLSLALTLSNLGAIEFESDILPIFSSKCAKCHLDGKSKGGLALDLDEIGGDIGAGKAISPGDPDKSELIELVSLPDDDGDRMPPEGEGRPLSTTEIDKIKEWIQSGAVIGNGEPEMTEAEAEKPQRPEPIEGAWTNREGKVINATLMRVDGDKAVLQMNGKEFPYPISSLSDEGQAIVREFGAASEAASGF